MTDTFVRLGDIKKYVPPTKSKGKPTERGELLVYFVGRINAERDGKKYKKVSIPYVARKLQGFELNDLYYLRSTCNDAATRGYSWSKCFFGSIKPK